MSLSERFSNLRQELKELQTKEIQFELDLQQHERALEAIASLPNDRKCYRLVGEALVQMTIEQARPGLQQQKSNLKELVDTFKQKVTTKEEEIIKFQKDNNIQIRPLSEVQRS